MPTTESTDIITKFIDLLKWALAPTCTLLAGYIGVIYGLKQVRIQKILDFKERQLKEFYSPLLGYHKEIRAKSELTIRVAKAANEAWQEVCERSPKPFLNSEKEYESYKKIIEYDNKQLWDELIPLYHKMLLTFRENYWLAEQETRKYYSELCDFVELWERWKTKSIPAEVIKKLEHTEDKLKSFYQDLENQLDILRNELSK
jgi:hypothetical protein